MSWLGAGHNEIGFEKSGQDGGVGGCWIEWSTWTCWSGWRNQITHQPGAVNLAAAPIPGRDAEECFGMVQDGDDALPRGGSGGDRGLYGMDDVNHEEDFCQQNTLVDRKGLYEKYWLADAIKRGDIVGSSRAGQAVARIGLAVAFGVCGVIPQECFVVVIMGPMG